MTVIYIDTLFLLNAIVDYLLLLASARLAGEPLHRLRMALAAALGGLYAGAVFLPGMGFLTHPACKVGCGVLMVVVGLGAGRRLLRQTVIFFALSCAFGGGVLAVGLLGGTGLSLSQGVIYTGMDLKIVLVSAAACYAAITLAMGRIARHSPGGGEVLPVTLALGERTVSLLALVDTGNTLTDPVSGRGVMVAEGESLRGLFLPGCVPERADLADPIPAMTKLDRGELRGRLRLLPYRAVGVDHGMLLALRPDRVTVAGREKSGMLVALSPTPVSDGGAYRALIHEE